MSAYPIEVSITMLVCINGILMALEADNVIESESVEWLDSPFLVVYNVELIVKLGCLGPRLYFGPSLNTPKINQRCDVVCSCR